MALACDVLVIGGGATGAGVAWDAALRGLDVMLVERGDLATGTSGRFHGLLHSGGRYVVKDPLAARECVAENRIVRQVAAGCIEDTGGLFVTTPWDEVAYADTFASACARCGVPCEEIEVEQALRAEPRLNPRITRAFQVPDASIDVWELVWGLARGAQAHGAKVLTYREVVAVQRDGDHVTGATVRDSRTGRTLSIRARVTVNATGAWAGRVAQLAGIDGVRVLPGRGIMIALNHRLVNTVVNRCTMPGDGDILVPIRTVSVIGTTDHHTDDPDDVAVPAEEVRQMLEEGDRLVPGLSQARALRAWAGVRPLFEDAKADGTATREVTRAHALLDHRKRDRVGGFVTITGGKLTTFRLMAEQTVDAVCAQLGEERICRTHSTPLPGSEAGEYKRLGARLGAKEGAVASEQIICECELVTRQRLEGALRETPGADLDDIRRRLRVGMGPCQGGFCIYRAAGVMHEAGIPARRVNAAVRSFIAERRRGVEPLLADADQLRQRQIDDWIFRGVLGVEP